MARRKERGAGADLGRVAKVAFWTYVVALVIQAAHFVEHIAQIHQFVWLADPRPKGLFGSVFDFAWVHFAYNASIFLVIFWCYALWLANPTIWRPSRWGAIWFHSLVAFQAYHVLEHTVQMYQYYQYGLLVPPGIIGQFVPNIIAHFDINGIMTLQMLIVLLVFQPSPRPHGGEARPPVPWVDRLPKGFRSGVLGSGGIAVFLVVLIALFAGTAPAAVQDIPFAKEHCLNEPKEHFARTTADWSFRDVTEEAGVSFVVGEGLPPMGRQGLAGTTSPTSADETHPMKTLIGGLSVADADGDGWQDFLVVDSRALVLYRNVGGTFENATAESGLEPVPDARSALWFDYDGDGDPDLFVAASGSPSRLWRNEGGLRFTDVTEEAGVGRTSSSHAAAAADVDNDGDLDLSVVNYGPWWEHGPETQATAQNGDQDFLYVNDGNGTFTEEALLRGVQETKWSFSHAWADYDYDGDQDLYVNVDFGFDEFYVNDGSGRFKEVSAEVGLITEGNGMGAVWVDYDNDLDLDLFDTNIYIACNGGVPQFRGNDLFQNNGKGAFTDVAAVAGIADGGWGWDSEWFDADHDGDVDAFQANGFSTRGEVDRYHDALVYLSDEAPKQLRVRNQGEEPSVAYVKYNATKYVVWSFYPPLAKQQVDDSSQGGHQVDRFWINDGGRFMDASASVGFTDWSDSRAAAAIDHDNDGDMDLLWSAWQRPIRLLENPADASGGHWLKLRLAGTDSPGEAWGAMAVVRTGETMQMRLLAGSGGFLSQSERVLHFGLGEATEVDEIVVRWPSGKESRLEDVGVDRVVEMVEPA